MIFKRPETRVCVCLECDRDTTKMGTRLAEGRAYFRSVKQLVKAQFPGVKVQGTSCTGGCACRTVEEDNAACSIALMGEGRFGYVLRRMNPQNLSAVAAFIKAYHATRTGMLTPARGGIAEELRAHIATRLPVLK